MDVSPVRPHVLCNVEGAEAAGVDENDGDNEEDEVVNQNTAETAEETEGTDTNADKELEEPPTEAADEIPENVITELKKIDISCKLCPYKAATNFSLGKHVKKIHPAAQEKNAGEEMIKLVQAATDKLIESAKKNWTL